MRFIVRIFTVIGVLVVLLVAAGIGVAVWERSGRPKIADNTVLTIDIKGPFSDAPRSGGLANLLMPEQPSLRDVLDGLERAGDDPHVKGLVARIADGELGLAQVQELRDAIAAFRAKGKRAVAYADSFGEFSSGMRSYYLAAAFDEIWVQPLGLVGLNGLRAEVPFFRGTLDLLGVVPRFDHREEFKTAMNSLTETSMTPAHREETEAIVDSVFGQMVRGISADRKIDEATLRGLIDRGPLLTKEALDAHLIDHVGYGDEARTALRSQLGDNHLVSLAHYLKAAGHPHTSGPTIALIYADGLIGRGDSSDNPVTGSSMLGADTVIRAFQEATDDPAVRAILFRIDSPGGSAVASESIWRATVRAKEAGKKIIVSMGDVAGSGGYYIAAAADKIVAEPATLTASIGVLAGKMLVSGLMDKLGISADSVQVGDNADLFSALKDFSPAEHERFEAFLDDVYSGFKERVAQGRGLDAAAVEEIAKGRVWTGEDAKARKLVDALGGYATALQLAKAAAGIPAASDVTIKVFPPPKDQIREIIARALGREDDSDDGSVAMVGSSLAALRPLLTELQLLSEPPGATVMTPIEIR